MGVNQGLAGIGHLLGIGGNSAPQLAQPNPNPLASFGPQGLLGRSNLMQAAPGAGQNDGGEAVAAQAVGAAPQAPAQDAAPADIEVQGQAPQHMSPEGLGMPGFNNSRAPDQNAVEDLRNQLKQKADLARDLYHHGSEFGTHGILRDVVGNVEDFGRRLLGFSPRYNDEKWTERAYGMSSTDPNVAAAATEQAMQYNPEKTQAYRQHLVSNQNTMANSAATTEYKNSQAAAKNANLLSGLGAQLYQANNGPDVTPEQAQTNYARAVPAIQSVLDKTYGPGVMQAPTQYDPNFVRQLAQAGFTGSNVQRAQANTLDNDVKERIANMSDSTKRALAGANNETRIRIAQIVANSSMGRAQLEAAIRREVGLAPEVETTQETGSIIHPTKTVTRQKGGNGGAAPAAPQKKFWNGHWWTRGPNGEAIQAD